MRTLTLSLAALAALTLSACTHKGFDRARPDEFSVTRNQPLVVPPDFALVPPAPGAPSPTAVDARSQAIDALFGGPAPRSASERQVLTAAGDDRAAEGVRSTAGDPATNVVDKGATTRTILAVPEGNGQEARVNTPTAQGEVPTNAPASATPAPAPAQTSAGQVPGQQAPATTPAPAPK